ncbi:hypothetical protein [Aeromonas caviae]|uniref:hypothetical protein n=1 Tax=Aeromonas caviae TaxID=648 RepID=UPI0038D10188
MPFIKKHQPFIPAVFDPALSDQSYYKLHEHPCNSINMEPQTHNVTTDELAALIVATENAIDEAGYWIAPSPFIYRGKNNTGYKRHLSTLLTAWVVQRDTVAHLLPYFWVYAAIKMRDQPDFLGYLENILEHEYRTCQVWESIARVAQSDIRYHVTVQQCPIL